MTSSVVDRVLQLKAMLQQADALARKLAARKANTDMQDVVTKLHHSRIIVEDLLFELDETDE